MSTIDLITADQSTCGGKAAPLGELLRAGFNVPAGFVVPTGCFRDAVTTLGLDDHRVENDEARSRIMGWRFPDRFIHDVDRAMSHITDGASTDFVAVRSSSVAEDTASASAAGQHDSSLAVRGTEQVCRAILKCWASAWNDRAAAYRSVNGSQKDSTASDMAVLVQRFVDGQVSGIMFTGETTVLEASWGIGDPIVGGHVTPDLWRSGAPGILERRPGLKESRADRRNERVVTHPVSPAEQKELCLTDEQVLNLHSLGKNVSATLGGPRDIEWALAAGTIWVLQARPITASIPSSVVPPLGPTSGDVLSGEPASPGVVTGRVRLVRGPADFPRVQPGDVLVCSSTDPAWTPLFTIASGVVTETGGVLSHAAIVAREVGIPAVLAVPRATTLLAPSSTITINGDTGHITLGQS